MQLPDKNMINKEAIKDALICVVCAFVTILGTLAIVLAINAIFKSTLWRVVVAIAVISVVVFIHAYYQFKGRY